MVPLVYRTLLTIGFPENLNRHPTLYKAPAVMRALGTSPKGDDLNSVRAPQTKHMKESPLTLVVRIEM